MLTPRNIITGARSYDVWAVNEDAEYHEPGAAGVRSALDGCAWYWKNSLGEPLRGTVGGFVPAFSRSCG
jgi:hypothetical protein